MKSSIRSPTSMSCCSVMEAAYFLISCTFARVSGSASVISEHIWCLSRGIVNAFPFLGLRNRFPFLCLFVRLRYSLRADTGHILLTWPVVPKSVWISLVSILFLSPFLAKNEECGLRSSEFLSVNLQKSSSLTQACTSLILHPVASRRKAVFLGELVSEDEVDASRNDNTLFKRHCHFGEGS